MSREAQGDSDENSKWNYIRIKPYAEYAEGFLKKFTAEPTDTLRYTQLQKATSVGKLVFQYIQQYCVPYTRYAIGRSEENKWDFDIDGQFNKLIRSFEQLLAALAEASDGGENAVAAQKLGREVIARLRARIADPLDELSIAEQEKFRFDVSKLRQLIVDSADEVRKADEGRESGVVGPVSTKRSKDKTRKVPLPPPPLSGMTAEDAVDVITKAVAKESAKVRNTVRKEVRSLKPHVSLNPPIPPPKPGDFKIGKAFPFVKRANRDEKIVIMDVQWKGVRQEHTFHITNHDQWKVTRQLVMSDDVKVKIDKTLIGDRSMSNIFRNKEGRAFYQYMCVDNAGSSTTWTLYNTPQDHSIE